LFLGSAVHAIVTRTAVLHGDDSRLNLDGTDAVLLGIVLACVALFLHTHYFWGNSRRLLVFHEAGKTVALLGFCGFGLWLVLRILKDTFS
jgi:hypothetical protein